MDAARPGPRRSDERDAESGETPRRGTSHGVALAMAIGLTALILIGNWAYVFWMDEGKRRPVAAPEPAVAQPAEEPGEPSPAAVEAERREAIEPVAAKEGDSGRAELLPEASDGRWRVRVIVTEPLEDANQPLRPLPGAQVEISLAVANAATVVARLVADPAGVVVHDLTVADQRLLAKLGRTATIGATASAPLHRSVNLHLPLPSEPGVVEFRLWLHRGACVRGRVVDWKAMPVAGATVGGLAVEQSSLDERVTKLDGCFELPIRESGTWRLFARADGIGGVATAPFPVDAALDLDAGDLVLRARGSVGGRIVDGRGEPAADVVVEAFDEEVGPTTGNRGIPLVAEAGGLRRGRSVSRSDGMFAIDGLADGVYRLATPVEPSREEGGPQLHELGDRSARLVVTRHRLRVVVVDEAGAPIGGAQISFRWGSDRRTTMSKPDGSALFHGKAGQRIFVATTAPDCVPAEGDYTFGEVHDDAELVLTLRPVGARTGSLALTIVDEAGAAVTPATITLRTPLGTLVEEWYRKPLPASGRLEGLAAGRFQVEAFGGAPLAVYPDSSLFFPAMGEVELRADTTTELTLRLRAGGRLRFTLRTPPGASKDRLAGAEFVHLPPLPAPPALNVVYRVHDDGGVEFGGCAFEPDVAYLSAPLLDPGVHRLRFTAPGFLPIEQSFTIRAGQVTDVDLALTNE